MKQKILRKVLASTLVISMTLINILALAKETLALNTSLEAQGMSTNNASVNFDAYFKDEQGNKIHTTTTNIKENANLYLYVSVTEGYLKETKITLNNPNFKLISNSVENDAIEKIDTETNTVTLNKIRKGEEIEISIPVESIKAEEVSSDMFSKETGVSISGLLVKDNTRTTKISKEIKVKANWTGTAEINLEQGVIKYVPYEQNEEKGIVLQTKIKVNLIDSNLPIEKTNIQTVIPTINGISPEKIYVTSDSTKATNGNDGANFNSSNWNKDKNTINIEVTNRAQDNKIIWKKGCVDEYIVTYIYGENAYETIKQNIAQISLDTTAEVKAYNLETTKLTKQSKINGTLNEKLNNFVVFNVSTQEQINKGYMYTGNETEYLEKLTIDVANEQLANQIILNVKENTLTSEIQSYEADTQYKTTKVNVENFKTMLSENGFIKIYNQNNEQIAIINKDSATDENNNYVINYDTKISALKIETSEIKTVGKLKIENTKTIIPSYTKEQFKEFNSIKTQMIGEVVYKEEKIISQDAETNTILVEPTTKANTTISNNTLSTIVNNENVEIRTILKSSDITCKLFTNPIVEIKLPEYIEDVTFNDVVKVLFTDELEIESGTYNKETKTIRIVLKGEQTKYNDVSIAEGATIVLNCNIKLNKLTPSKSDEFVTTITNEQEVIETKTQVNYVAPVGMVTVNSISGYSDNTETSSVSGQESTGKIETNSGAKTAIVTLTLINNNNNVCKNITILGRTPFEGNRSITTNEELGSTFTAEVTSKINATSGINNNNITVYYSSNENATKDLSDTTNGWTTEPQNLSEVKSYLIIVNNYEMQTGESFSFEYNTKIPEGLRNDEKTFGTFVVYYDNIIEKQPTIETQTNNNSIENTTTNNNVIENTTILSNNVVNNEIVNNNVVNNTIVNNTTENTNTQNNTTKPNKENEVLVSEQTQAPTVGVATEKLPDVKVTLSTDLPDEEYVLEGQVINYTATVVNMGKDTINNATLSIPVPTGTTCRKYIQGTSFSSDEIVKTEDTEVKIDIAKLEPNKTQKLELQVIVNEMKDNEEITAKAILNIDGYDQIESEAITSSILKGILNIDMFTYLDRDENYKTGDEIKYRAYVQNIKESTNATNVKVSCTMPEAVEYVSAEYMEQYDNDYNKVSYDESTNTVTWEINKIAAKAYKGIILTGKVKEGFTEITNQMAATCTQATQAIFSNEVKRYVENVNLVVDHSTDVKSEYVDVGDKINYYINITNNGTATATNVKILDTLPQGVESVKASYKGNTIQKDNIPTKNGTITLSGHTIEPGETLKVTINVTVSELANDAKGTIELRNSVEVTANDIAEAIKPNDVIHKIKVREQPKEPEKKEIEVSGVAWLDSSRDGKRDDNEQLLKNIEVTLITKEEAKVVKTTKTDKKGKYTFKNIESGEYLIVFKFDTTKYGITKYIADGVNEGTNSDAALQQVTFLDNGKTIEGAVTDTIKVENANIYNIDLGLVENLKFDLSLSKTISKVTKQNDEGMKTYDYTGDNKTLAKIEIPSKQVNKTTIVVEYTITVKNEGNVAGYAKNIVDYLPSDLKFSSEMNKDWYKATDGNLYNKSLADTLIQPGESKEIKLVVTKTMSENNLGMTTNQAEIYESYNDYGVKDIDSTDANKVTKEDDYGSADVVVSLNTGTVVMYTGLIITSIMILGVGVYMIKKKVLGEE